MSRFNIITYLNAYEDRTSTNNPSKNNFKWEREIYGLPAENPTSLAFSLAPGEARTLFSGVRTLTQDGTTQYSIALVAGQTTTYQLSWVAGTAPQFRTPRVTSADATTQVTVTLNGPVATFTAAGVAAFFTGQIAGMTTDVTITASHIGVLGNSVSLTSDGTSSIAALIAAWNAANPSNTIALTTGDGTQVPTSGSIALAGGSTPVSLLTGGVVVGDFVRIGSNFNISNQGEWQIISLTATGFSVANLGGVAEGPITLGSGFAAQLDIYGASGVQVGDSLVISGGFSPVTQGTYLITAVTDGWLRFSSVAILPTEGPILTEAITVYSAAQKLVYLESDQHVGISTNGVSGNEIMPVVDCCGKVKPGMFLVTSTIYTMIVTNLSENQANLTFIAIE